MRTTVIITALVILGLGVGNVTYQQFGGPNDGVGETWYDSVYEGYPTSYPAPNTNQFTITIEPEKNGKAQDVKGTYTVVKGADGVYRGSGANFNGTGMVDIVITREGTNGLFLWVGFGNTMWHANNVLIYRPDQRSVYWRLGGQSGCVKVTGSY